MALEHPPTSASLVDVLDRVLDKGIVIDAWVRVSVVGIDVITIEARVVVASIQTYLQYTNLLATAALASAATLDSVRRTPASRRLIRSSR